MKKTSPILLIALLLTASISLQAQQNLFPEGSCELMDDKSNLPEGFFFPDKNDKPWKAGNTASTVEEEGNKFIRFLTTEAYPGFYAVSFDVPIPEIAGKMRISARFRSKYVPSVVEPSWKGYRVHFNFATNPPVGRKFETIKDVRVIDLQNEQPEWVEKDGSAAVPDGAKYLRVMILSSGYVGQYDLDDIQIFAE